MNPVVGFAGLGRMGEPMARNLLRGGCDLRVWNRTASRAESLVREGATLVSTPAETARGSEVTLVMVADPPALERVLHGAEGILSGLRPGSVLVNMGTQDIAQVEAVAGETQRLGASFLDAPVTGSRTGAVEGTLTILAGGEAVVLERTRPVLEKMGRTILHVGHVGDGTRAKLVLNLIQAGMLTLWAEGLSLARKLGLSPVTILQVLEHSAGDAPLFRTKGPSLLKRDFSAHFSLKLMDKDLKLALREADRLQAGLTVSQTVSSLFSAARAAGFSEDDFLAIARLVEKLAGTVIEP